MASLAVSFRYFILGLLAQQPMSGYDIRRFLQSLGWLLGSPSYGAIYPALHALANDGLVLVDVMSRPDKPLRKIYTITQPGRQALEEWVARPVEAGVKLKSFIMQLILAGDFAQPALVAHLQQRRETVQSHHSTLEQTIQDLGDRANAGQRLALEYGLATSAAEVEWLDDTLARVRVSPEVERAEPTT
jgi:DNA-binding PadR family transcriptional regulator